MNRLILLFALGLCFLVSFSQNSGDTIIVPDRPGMSTPPFLIPARTLEIESGYSFERTIDPKQISVLYNTSLFRYGLNPNCEIRLQVNYSGFKDSLNYFEGFDPLTIGSKLLIFEGQGAIPRTSFLFNLTLPGFGYKEFRPANPVPSAYLLMQNDFSDDLNLCYNLGMEWADKSSEVSYFAAVCLGYNISDKLSCFAESYSYFEKSSDAACFADAGLLYLLNNNLQIDISGNIDLIKPSNYYMLSFGAEAVQKCVSK
ncbi:MAG: transporter [Bacteroidia bacterium]|nr:transporter [Bacteroidia bacterium]